MSFRESNWESGELETDACLLIRKPQGVGDDPVSSVFALPSEGPELEPQNPHKQWSRVVCVCDPTAGEVQTGRSSGPYCPATLAYLGKFQACERVSEKKKKVDSSGGTIPKAVLWSTRACAHTCILTHKNTPQTNK